ncbi:MAG: hypothetical protein OXU20_19670 [Myxococcales bacterium]|nr:hypothetical protein [Myxococcales bacterium]
MIEFRKLPGRMAFLRFPEQVVITDVSALGAEVSSHLQSVGGGAIYCVDCSRMKLFAPEVAEALVALMKSDNPLIDRTGVLVNGSATFGMQVERMLREADNPRRRAFRDPQELADWLCDAAEADAVRELRTSLGLLDDE